MPDEKIYKKGLLPLSADPVTYGHLDLIQKAASDCTELLVAMLPNPGKAATLPEKERLALLDECVRDLGLPHVRVLLAEGTTTDIYLQEDCDVVFRGVRDPEEHAYEVRQAQYHQMAVPGVDLRFHFVHASPKWAHVQSSVVRSFASNNLPSIDMAPMKVQARLWRHLNSQKILGVSGVPGCGKSAVIQAIVGVVQASGLGVTVVDMKALDAELMGDTSPGGVAFRKRLEGSAILFDKDTEALRRAHLHRLLRSKIKGKKGLILVEGSFLVEDKQLSWVCNNMLFVQSSLEVAATPPHRTENTLEAKILEATGIQAQDKYGTLMTYEHVLDEFPTEAGEMVRAWIRKGDF